MVLILHPTFTADRITEFFEQATQLAMVDRTVTQLALEGITGIVDLPEYTKTDIESITRTFERPARIVNGAGNLVNQPAFTFSAKSQKRMLTAILITTYYEQTSRVVTPAMMQWTVMKNFSVEMEALKESVSPTEITPMKSSTKITKFLEYFQLHCHGIVGKRNTPLDYVLRSVEAVPAIGPVFLPNQAYSADHGSVEGELIARLSFDHPLYRNDNAQVYQELAKGLGGTKYIATILRFRLANGIWDGRGAFLAVKSQHAGKSVWEAQIKENDDFVKARTWNGQTTTSLEVHIDGHRNAHVALTEASHHVDFQLPNERTRVTNLLDSIKCVDPTLLAAIAAVYSDDPGKRDVFELTAAYISPSCPVAKKRQHSKRPIANVSGITNDGNLRKMGDSGVELRWYKHPEYVNLSDDQKEELKGWAATQPDNRNASKKNQKNQKKGQPKKGKRAMTPGSNKFKKHVRAQVAAALANKETQKTKKSGHDEGEINGFISAIKTLAQSAKPSAKADVGSTDVVMAEPAEKPDAEKAAEIQLRGILHRQKVQFRE